MEKLIATLNTIGAVMGDTPYQHGIAALYTAAARRLSKHGYDGIHRWVLNISTIGILCDHDDVPAYSIGMAAAAADIMRMVAHAQYHDFTA